MVMSFGISELGKGAFSDMSMVDGRCTVLLDWYWSRSCRRCTWFSATTIGQAHLTIHAHIGIVHYNASHHNINTRCAVDSRVRA